MDATTDAVPQPGFPPPPPPPSSPGGPSGPRRLRRRPDDGHIGGVCSGVAEYFNVDPLIVRIAAVVLLFSGPGAFAYVLAWIFVPAATGAVPHGAPQAPIDRRDRGTQIFGIVLLGLALSVLWGDWWSPVGRWLFPLGLMTLGAWLLLRPDKATNGDEPESPFVSQAPTSGWTSTPPEPLASPVVDADAMAPADGAPGAPGAPWEVAPTPAVPSPPALSHPHRRMLGPIVFGTLLVWAGLAFLTGVTIETGLAGSLLIVGIGFVLGSFMGGSRILILPALLVGGALAVAAVVDIPLSGPIGRQEWAPRSAAEIEDLYDVSMGEGVLDLTAIRLPAGDELEVEASVGIGHLLVLVPADLALEVSTDVGTGESDVLGFRQDGVGVTTDRRIGGAPDRGTLRLDLQVGLGEIEVRRTDDDVRPLG